MSRQIGVFIECDDADDAEEVLEKMTEGIGYMARVIEVNV